MNNNQDNKEEKFENELHASLKFYGYLFPENENEVIVFDKLYGKTEIETPSFEKLISISDIALDSDIVDLNMRSAAFSPRENQMPTFLNDDSIKDIDSSKKEDE